MKSIILCEGKTDAIVISYYLEKTQNWKFLKNASQVNETRDRLVRIPIQDRDSESANWYERDGNHLAIWAIGGQSKFDYALREVMTINKREDADKCFAKIALVTDRDKNADDGPILSSFTGALQACGMEIELSNSKWAASSFQNAFQETLSLSIVTLIIPFDKPGALETFLLDALCEQPDEKHVIDAARQFISSLTSDKYLPNERTRLKADLSTTFAILNPERVFTINDEIMRSIRWEEYSTVQSGFRLLEQV